MFDSFCGIASFSYVAKRQIMLFYLFSTITEIISITEVAAPCQVNLLGCGVSKFLQCDLGKVT